MADAAILPLLNRLGIRVIDTLIISHRDRDHAGNRQALLQSMAVRRELSSFPLHRLPRPAAEVSSGIGRGLDVRVLWPLAAGAGRNNDSCVVQLDDGRHRLLLSGDIEQQAERRLLALALEEGEGAGLASTLLVSPHHGSRTSSTAPSWRR